MGVQSGLISGQLETARQPASRFAGRHGADHRGGGAGISAVPDFSDVQVKSGGAPTVVRMAKLQNSAPHRLGMTGIHGEASAPENFKRA